MGPQLAPRVFAQNRDIGKPLQHTLFGVDRPGSFTKPISPSGCIGATQFCAMAALIQLPGLRSFACHTPRWPS